jgi:uncharacterized membrane protein
MKTRTAVLAAAAGALFLSGAVSPAFAEEGKEGKVKCEGVNSCKGHSECSSAHNECAGKNSCKGKGFVMMTPEACKAAKAKETEKENEG